uniref:Uncharacterized protein n=1 Tax=OCS116 cluster bacterium TaxID=2030921 RepID=A0A2A4Z8T6_9PROT
MTNSNSKTKFHQVSKDLTIVIDSLQIKHLIEIEYASNTVDKEFVAESYIIGDSLVSSDLGLGIIGVKRDFSKNVSVASGRYAILSSQKSLISFLGALC